MRRQRRDAEAFSMSFLDCICCGFGAVILLLVVTEYGDNTRLQVSKEDLQMQVEKDEQALHEIRGEALLLEKELRARIAQLSEEQSKLARLRGDLSKIEGQYKASENEEDAMKKLTTSLSDARAAMIEETRKLQGEGRRQVYAQPVAGVPIDSEYVIFIVDTSGSM
jgi:septal ring factor EnvC (AmiA/AmiB activator)